MAGLGIEDNITPSPKDQESFTFDEDEEETYLDAEQNRSTPGQPAKKFVSVNGRRAAPTMQSSDDDEASNTQEDDHDQLLARTWASTSRKRS